MGVKTHTFAHGKKRRGLFFRLTRKTATIREKICKKEARQWRLTCVVKKKGDNRWGAV